MTERIRIDDLHISIERRDDVVRAVDGVSLSLAGNEILALVGESGSGKTLTARSALKLLPRGATTRGAVLVEGQDVLSVPGDTLRKIRGGHAAMVFQEPSTALNPVYTIGWQLEEGLRAHGVASRAERHARGLQALKDVGIPEPERRYHDYPHQFSGGQKQRIVIAMALSLKPGVIIADEPTTALDVTVQAEILDLLRKCRDELGTAIILITHNMGVVADLADRVAVMYQGKVVETADVHSLFAQPQHPYTRRLLASVPRFGQAVRPQRTPAAGEPPVLRAEKLEITYPGRFRKPPFRAVRGVDFEVRKGEIFGLVGESGSGKSTIGRAIAGLTATSGGVLEFLGTDLRRASRAEVQRLRRKLGFVFQDPASSFNPFMSIADCIAEPMRIHRTPAAKREIDARVRELLDAVQLPSSFASRTPMELSGGQRQRVGVARALALKPEFVIADEPTSALDVSVQATILRLLGDLHEELGFAALFITHDLAVVEEFADRVGVLKQGEFMEIAPAETLLKEARDSYTRALINAVPIPDPVAQRAKRKRAV
ncbi:dipeptide ABC transporter ATP-binding protein [Sediminivirga luteola]|uniref:ABC transporter ATP-binding protein n=1 Tax=Sediminivirga luteola TaxID=1774748 RepID=A0A8J2TW05_9MICO|nr:ABC transporter ATP-binding protein [Sediminivirga luteola]GGA06410.1 ABC transporter ATP-binding protein [Sediminivirga luteola]